MQNYLNQIRGLVTRVESQARKQVNAQLPRRRAQLLAAVRRVRKLVNQRLGALERRLMSAGKAKRR